MLCFKQDRKASKASIKTSKSRICAKKIAPVAAGAILLSKIDNVKSWLLDKMVVNPTNDKMSDYHLKNWIKKRQKIHFAHLPSGVPVWSSNQVYYEKKLNITQRTTLPVWKVVFSCN